MGAILRLALLSIGPLRPVVVQHMEPVFISARHWHRHRRPVLFDFCTIRQRNFLSYVCSRNGFGSSVYRPLDDGSHLSLHLKAYWYRRHRAAPSPVHLWYLHQRVIRRSHVGIDNIRRLRDGHSAAAVLISSPHQLVSDGTGNTLGNRL
ncbi:hypothetical protein SLS63_011768 [Diaporthe eres]|uniref:Secreted protein n=1 Tax=Diaporthe eres TaxID=83184 RepID=A0ABR1NT63_DIAER